MDILALAGDFWAYLRDLPEGPVIQALGVAVAALIAFHNIGRAKKFERREQDRRRRERVKDIVVGLYYEITAGAWSANRQLAKDKEADQPDYIDPIAPSDRSDFVFESVKGDISILPFELIEVTVDYYKWSERTNRYTDLLVTDRFLKLIPARKRETVAMAKKAIDEQAKAGRTAKAAYQVYMKDNDIKFRERDPSATDAPAADVSTTGATEPAAASKLSAAR